MIWGTDVSGYQPDAFDLDKSDGTKYQFVFIKATQGVGYVNPRFKAQRAYAISKGLRVGYYHFLEQGNAIAQVEYFHNFLNSGGYIRPGDMIACDWEGYTKNGQHWNASNSDKDTFIHNALLGFPESRVVLYCNTSQWKNVDKTSVVGDGLWIAAPSDPDGKPSIQHPWVFQQTGIDGQDVDLANFASRAALNTWADGKVKAPVTDAQAPKSVAYKQVWETDAMTPPNGQSTAVNSWWMPQSVLRYAAEQAAEANAKADKALALIQAIAAKVGA